MWWTWRRGEGRKDQVNPMTLLLQWTTGWWFQILFIFTPIWGKIKLDDHIFSKRGWFNHQLDQPCLKWRCIYNHFAHVGYLIAMFLFSRNEHVQSARLSRATSFCLAGCGATRNLPRFCELEPSLFVIFSLGVPVKNRWIPLLQRCEKFPMEQHEFFGKHPGIHGVMYISWSSDWWWTRGFWLIASTCWVRFKISSQNPQLILFQASIVLFLLSWFSLYNFNHYI